MARSLTPSSVAVCLAILILVSSAVAAPTPAQRDQLLQVRTAIKKAGNLYTQGKYKESADVVKEVHGQVEKLASSGNKDVLNELTSIYANLEKAQALLELEGIELPAIKKPMEKPAEPASSPATPGVPTGAVSFVKDVAPIVVARCGNCHVRGARGQVSFANFDSFMKGKETLKDVFVIPNQPKASFLMDVITEAKMPPSGMRIPDNEIAILTKWITDGAKFDGKDPQESLSSLAPGVKAATGPKVELAVATGKEKISFANDIAPMLNESCYGCHGGGRRPEGMFNLTTFDGLLRGGETGAPLVPGKPAESLLIKKLKGTAMVGQRMPARKEKWSDDMIAKVELWISEGAKFDGLSPRQDLKRVAAVAKAMRATHEELSADRAALAEANWKLGSPSIKPVRSESTNFLVFGDLGENTLKDIAERAEAVAPKVAKILKADPDRPLLKGRFSLFVFGERYGYSEFGQMVEKRQLPKEWRGHWMYDIVDAYGVVFPSRSNEYALEPLVAQQLTGAYVSSLGRSVPRWFAEGTGRVVASKLDPADIRARSWNENVTAAVSGQKKPDEFMSAGSDSEASDVCSFSFVGLMMSDLTRYQRLIEDLRNGVDFDKAFAASYGAPPTQAAQAWAKRPYVAKAAPAKKTKK